jgi:hypothetical protein
MVEQSGGTQASSSLRQERLTAPAVTFFLNLFASDECLKDMDRKFLTIHGLARASERRVIPFGKVPNKDFGRCVLLGLDGLVRYLRAPTHMWFTAVRQWCRSYTRWERQVFQHERHLLDGVRLGERELTVIAIKSVLRKRFGLPLDHKRFLRMIREENIKLGRPADEESVRQDLRVYRQLTWGVPTTLYRDEEGLHPGRTQYRDVMAKFHGVPRSGDKDPVASAAVPLDSEPDAGLSVLERSGAGFSEEPSSDMQEALYRSLERLPNGVVDLISEVQSALDAEAILDAVSRAAKEQEPAVQAALLRKATGGKISRDRAKEVFGTSIAKIRTAEEKI